MEITVDTRALAKIEADALVTYAFEQEKPVEGVLARLDEALASRPGAAALQARGSILAMSEALTEHPAYFDAGAPG